MIGSSRDLVTAHQATREGFARQAAQKRVAANEYVARAQHLKCTLSGLSEPQAALEIPDIQRELIAAAAYSDKATQYFSDEELKNELRAMLQSTYEIEGKNWRDAIVFRFLLTRGDSLGGTMRNLTGSTAASIFAEAILETLNECGFEPKVFTSPNNSQKISAISWDDMAIYFDRTPRGFRNNIDVILSRIPPQHRRVYTLPAAEHFVACGELKGGIDPAGADEHWKTASSALARIREAYADNGVLLFFAGAAIEDAMASQIYAQVESGELDFAANLTISAQVADLCQRLIVL